MNQDRRYKWVKWLTGLIIVGLIINGVTALPLETELDAVAKFLGGTDAGSASGFTHWILKIRDALHNTYSVYPFMAYGTDWLAFGHFAIAIAFVGALRDPIRNRWLFLFGMISCALVIPFAFACGAVRGIPLSWRLIDCSLGVFAFIPLWFCWKWTGELERLKP